MLSVLLLVSLACGAGTIATTQPASTNNQEQPSLTEPAEPTATPKPISTPQPETPDSPKGNGFYTVGEEITPGKWESTGDGNSCYWQRLDDKQETIANHFGLAGGTVTILESDYEVHLEDCGTWNYVEGLARNIQANATEPKEDGFYTVGVEIAPGKWESTGDGDSCYWQRLDDKQETIANHFGLAGGTVTILESDYEVHLEDCGTWNYVGK